MMMIVFGNLAELAQIQKAREFVKMEHRFVFTMFAEKRYVFAEIHILQIVRNITTIAALNALAEFLYDFLLIIRHKVIVYETEKKCKFKAQSYAFRREPACPYSTFLIAARSVLARSVSHVSRRNSEQAGLQKFSRCAKNIKTMSFSANQIQHQHHHAHFHHRAS
jgi:hypothetical protein